MDVNKVKIFGLEVYLDNFKEPKNPLRISKKQLKKSNFQVVERDFAFVVDDKVRASDLITSIIKTNLLIKSANIFDIYQGEKIEIGKKSLAIKVLFEPTDKTLTDKEIDELSDAIVLAAKNYGGLLRSQ